MLPTSSRPRLVETRRLMMLIPNIPNFPNYYYYFTSNQSEQCPQMVTPCSLDHYYHTVMSYQLQDMGTQS